MSDYACPPVMTGATLQLQGADLRPECGTSGEQRLTAAVRFPDIRVGYRITRTAGAVSSIAVTAHGTAVLAGDLVKVQVVKGHADGKTTEFSRVVFSEPISLVADPSSPQSLAAITVHPVWAGTLSPSNWAGGCRDATYAIRLTWSRFTAHSSSSQITLPLTSFNCRHAGG